MAAPHSGGMAPIRSLRIPLLGGLGAPLIALLPITPLLAAPDLNWYPPQDTFRQLQLNTLACGRENTATTCDLARRQADPLLDNRRLSVSCKDVLWQIRQLAVVAPANSLQRRDPIDKAAREVTQLCRQPAPPAKESESGKPGGGAGGRFSFGGGS
ncbi:MAG: hypothetical protein VKO65_01815 [Cyanobacteriota bacterium]|nr:hypothetical protein [Cyanobacteriota bacterium]